MTQFPTQTHFPDIAQTSPCHILIMPSAWLSSDKYQFLKSLILFDRLVNALSAVALCKREECDSHGSTKQLDVECHYDSANPVDDEHLSELWPAIVHAVHLSAALKHPVSGEAGKEISFLLTKHI